MNSKSAMPRRVKLAVGPLAVAALAAVTSACGGSPGGSSASTVTCTSYAVHGAGAYHDEVQVQVNVSNGSSAAADYQVDVAMALAGSTVGGGDLHVPVTGLVPAQTASTLSRKVLTVGKAQHCAISRLTRS